ncbi:MULTISPECIES: o-succinylbenzoate synthase [Trichocoleus]|uniref:o-succinylbenzoate synthase n=1 Tax=Trichocoleus desertorum GB2-A4 TaxID=2933944 RepID=A0ABV0J4R9_9CYAN|nr:o-succinylbenzoate synthase [Trichocoleus sp. FACHB-46]MBD1863615.1 o-succinylbenzoate synthase [Trichocoleus sp. FACHB-46]
MLATQIHSYQFEFRAYQRPFRQPLKTSQGLWNVRTGILLRLTDETGQVGFGEIAPLAWFGSETFEQTLVFCRQLPSEITAEHISAIPSTLPACQFGLESAWLALNLNNVAAKIRNPKSEIPYSALLPTGPDAVEAWRSLWQQGFYTFKWKVGVAAVQEELEILQTLCQSLPPQARLRLDANAGLTLETAIAYLQACDQLGIEFLEQPLPVNQFQNMLALSQQYSTPLALDESVATLAQLKTCYAQGWRGIFVIKPAIAGFPSQLRQFCQTHQIDAVFSSVFETAIGRDIGLSLAAELTSSDRAAGFGVTHWFSDSWDQLSDFEQLWNSL